MRTFTNTLLFENILDTTPTGDGNVSDLYTTITSPTVQVVEANCGTTCGELDDVTYARVGEMELATSLYLTKDRIDQLLGQGIYSVALANTSTCVSKGGVCQRCYSASYPANTIPAVGSNVAIPSEVALRVDVLEATPGQSTFALTLDPSTSKRVYVYVGNSLLANNVGYSITGTTLTLATPIPVVTNVVVKYVSNYYGMHMNYLANTYSGSLIGVKPTISKVLLPIRSLFLTSLIDANKLQSVRDVVSSLSAIDQAYIDYINKGTIRNTLEEALLLMALYNIYSGIR
jgi:hypothetical protein